MNRTALLWLMILGVGALFIFVPAFLLGMLHAGPLAQGMPSTLFIFGALTGWLIWKRLPK